MLVLHKGTQESEKYKKNDKLIHTALKVKMRIEIWYLVGTSNLLVLSIHLAGGDGSTAGVCVGADVSLEPPADRQVVHVLVVTDLVIFTLQRAQVKLVATPGVTNPTVLAWEDKSGQ